LITLTVPVLLGALLVISPSGFEDLGKEITSYVDLMIGGHNIDCTAIPMSELRGVVFIDNILSNKERGGSFDPPSDYVGESMRHIGMHDMNLVRVPLHWESYVNNPKAFMDELEIVARSAQANDLCVIFDNQHWYTTSYWGIKKLGDVDGRGFPSFVMKDFALVRSGDDYQSTAAPFWAAFLRNEITVDGRKVWDLQLEFLEKVIARVDKYENVVGYEILNEPHLFNASQYDELGNYHTYMAKGIREVSDKRIIFDRETANGFERVPSLEYKIVPRNVTGIVYSPHLYTPPFQGSQGQGQIANFKKWADQWGVEVFVGEWSASTQNENDEFLRVFKENGFGWTYHSWRPFESRGLGVSLYDTSWTQPTEGLRRLADSIERVYTIPIESTAVASASAK
jgi:hypothetical protein